MNLRVSYPSHDYLLKKLLKKLCPPDTKVTYDSSSPRTKISLPRIITQGSLKCSPILLPLCILGFSQLKFLAFLRHLIPLYAASFFPCCYRHRSSNQKLIRPTPKIFFILKIHFRQPNIRLSHANFKPPLSPHTLKTFHINLHGLLSFAPLLISLYPVMTNSGKVGLIKCIRCRVHSLAYLTASPGHLLWNLLSPFPPDFGKAFGTTQAPGGI